MLEQDLRHSDFSLGKTDAWLPKERKDLERNFLPITQFSEISKEDKTFLCGRRGTGKSAIAVMLQLRAPYELKEAVQGEREQYGEYLNIVSLIAVERDRNRSVDVKQSVRRLWLWVLRLKAMQTLLLSAEKNGEPFDKDLECIRRYFTYLPAPLHKE